MDIREPTITIYEELRHYLHELNSMKCIKESDSFQEINNKIKDLIKKIKNKSQTISYLVEDFQLLLKVNPLLAWKWTKILPLEERQAPLLLLWSNILKPQQESVSLINNPEKIEKIFRELSKNQLTELEVFINTLDVSNCKLVQVAFNLIETMEEFLKINLCKLLFEKLKYILPIKDYIDQYKIIFSILFQKEYQFNTIHLDTDRHNIIKKLIIDNNLLSLHVIENVNQITPYLISILNSVDMAELDEYFKCLSSNDKILWLNIFIKYFDVKQKNQIKLALKLISVLDNSLKADFYYQLSNRLDNLSKPILKNDDYGCFKINLCELIIKHSSLEVVQDQIACLHFDLDFMHWIKYFKNIFFEKNHSKKNSLIFDLISWHPLPAIVPLIKLMTEGNLKTDLKNKLNLYQFLNANAAYIHKINAQLSEETLSKCQGLRFSSDEYRNHRIRMIVQLLNLNSKALPRYTSVNRYEKGDINQVVKNYMETELGRKEFSQCLEKKAKEVDVLFEYLTSLQKFIEKSIFNRIKVRIEKGENIHKILVENLSELVSLSGKNFSSWLINEMGREKIYNKFRNRMINSALYLEYFFSIQTFINTQELTEINDRIKKGENILQVLPEGLLRILNEQNLTLLKIMNLLASLEGREQLDQMLQMQQERRIDVSEGLEFLCSILNFISPLNLAHIKRRLNKGKDITHVLSKEIYKILNDSKFSQENIAELLTSIVGREQLRESLQINASDNLRILSVLNSTFRQKEELESWKKKERKKRVLELEKAKKICKNFYPSAVSEMTNTLYNYLSEIRKLVKNNETLESVNELIEKQSLEKTEIIKIITQAVISLISEIKPSYKEKTISSMLDDERGRNMLYNILEEAYLDKSSSSTPKSILEETKTIKKERKTSVRRVSKPPLQTRGIDETQADLANLVKKCLIGYSINSHLFKTIPLDEQLIHFIFQNKFEDENQQLKLIYLLSQRLEEEKEEASDVHQIFYNFLNLFNKIDIYLLRVSEFEIEFSKEK